MERKLIDKIRDFLEWEVETLGGTTRLGVVGVAAAVFTLVCAFFVDFPAAHLRAAVYLGSGVLCLVGSLMAVTIGFSGASVTGGRGGLGCGLVGGVVIALTARPPQTT